MLGDGAKRDFVREFLSYLQVEKGLSKNTLQSYARDMTRLQQWAEQIPKPIEKLERKDLRECVYGGIPAKSKDFVQACALSVIIALTVGHDQTEGSAQSTSFF